LLPHGRIIRRRSICKLPLSDVLTHHGNLEEAIAYTRETCRRVPNNRAPYVNLGYLLEKKGLTLADKAVLDEAIATYRLAIQHSSEIVVKHAGLPEYLKGLASRINKLAWSLSTNPDPSSRDAAKSLALAKQALDLDPEEGSYWRTFGAAHYRAGGWRAALAALEKSLQFRKGGDSFDWFLLAMAHWQLGEKDRAQTWYAKAAEWMEKNLPQDELLRRFRAEAAALLKSDDRPKTRPESK